MVTKKIALLVDTREDLKHLYDLWLKFRKYYLKAFITEPISREEEHDFLEIKSEIAKYHRVLSEEVHENLYFAGDKIIELLRKSISVAHLRALPLVDKNLHYKMWHYIFIHLGRTLGAYQFFTEGYLPPKRTSKRDELVTISKLKGMAGSEGGIKKRKMAAGGQILKVVVSLVGAVMGFLVGYTVVRLFFG